MRKPACRCDTRASMGPRLVSRGKALSIALLTSSDFGLQWGRDLLVAESKYDQGEIEALAKLQWGRDLLVAESCGGLTSAVIFLLLQWGRDLLVAERNTFVLMSHVTLGFNGAATC